MKSLFQLFQEKGQHAKVFIVKSQISCSDWNTMWVGMSLGSLLHLIYLFMRLKMWTKLVGIQNMHHNQLQGAIQVKFWTPVNGTNFLTKTIHSTTKVMGKYILTRPIPLIFWLNQLLLMRMLSKVLNLWCMWWCEKS